MNNFEEKTKKQGTSQPEASQKENGDMASEWEELVELDDVQLATVVGGWVSNEGSLRHYIYFESLYGYGGSFWRS